MFKLLLVDDEPIIVEGLFELFAGYRGGSLDVYKAFSAKEALDCLNRRRIDVVITDIKMPEMDGLQLLEHIRRNWPDCRVIFLTGHDEFDYIYRAVQHEGVSYLLKTESYESIAAMVERYLQEILDSYTNEERIRQAESRMKKALPLLQKEFLSDLADGVETEPVTQQMLDDLEIPLDAGRPILLLMACAVNPPDKVSSSCRSCFTAANDTVEQYLATHASLAGFIHQRNYILWLVQPKPDSFLPDAGLEVPLYLRNLLESVQFALRESFHFSVSFVITGGAIWWQDIFLTAAKLKSVLNSSMRQGMEVIVTDRQSQDTAGDAGVSQQQAKVQLKKLMILESCLEQGKKDDFFRIFNEIREYFTRLPAQSGLEYEAHYAVSLLFISYVNRHGLKDFVLSKPGGSRLWDSAAYSTVEESFAFFAELAAILIEAQHVEMEKKSMASILKVLDFVQNNLSENLSLNNLAEMVYFNPKYLSRLFKQATGSNLSDYINEKKMAKAKELLRQRNIRIYEIAQAVGYSSNSYFTMFFKKGANMTPQEYRDSCSK